jgi:hypothetical protein
VVKRILRVILLLCCIYSVKSQEEDTSLYELLLMQVKIYHELAALSEENTVLLSEAQEYAASGEYEIAVIYLEQILSTIPKSSESIEAEKFSPLNISISSGVDFNRQEFELGYLQSDSIILEEFTKPYIGISLTYTPPLPVIISNIIRYDNDNIRNDYRLRWTKQQDWTLQYSGYLNLSTSDNSYSFWAHDLIGQYQLFSNDHHTLYLNNYFYYKNYENKYPGLYDFLRNRFELSDQWSPHTPYSLQLQYNNELHANLLGEHMDYNQNSLRLGYRVSSPVSFNHWLSFEGLIRTYKYQYLDTLQQNKYTQFNLNTYLGFPITNIFRFEIEYSGTNKLYREDTVYEPDYLWHYLRPAVIANLTRTLETGLGWEYESKLHSNSLTEDIIIKEQDYFANGLFLLLNYSSHKGSYISLSGSYQMRRYPSSDSEDLLTLYSNRNILSVYLAAYIPFSQHFYFNTFVTYDNDQDIDLDQQDTQSTIFSAEIGYKF